MGVLLEDDIALARLRGLVATGDARLYLVHLETLIST